MTGNPGRPPGIQDHEDIRGSMHVGRRQRVADGSQTSVPWLPSRSVIDSLGPAGAEFARNAESCASLQSTTGVVMYAPTGLSSGTSSASILCIIGGGGRTRTQ